MKICFVDTAKLDYSHKDINNQLIRGAESIFINFSLKLKEFGNEVYIFNNSSKEYYEKNYIWSNLNKIKKREYYDIVISNNDTQILSKFTTKKKFVISHSILTIEKAFRKNQLLSYFRNRPKYLLIGNYHKKKMSNIFSLFGNDIIYYGVEDIFQKTNLSDKIDNNLSFFTSRTDRNLDILIEIWKNDVFKNRSLSKLYVTPIKQDLKNYNIFNRPMLSKPEYINQILKSRMIILPGHKAELFCLAALEASELCIPVVTMGIGSLSERIEHNVTGLVSKNKSEFAKNILEMYQNHELWLKIRQNLISRRGQNTWNNAAKKFYKVLINN